MREFNIEVRYAWNYRFLRVTAVNARAAKAAILARDDHHGKVLGMKVVHSTGEKRA